MSSTSFGWSLNASAHSRAEVPCEFLPMAEWAKPIVSEASAGLSLPARTAGSRAARDACRSVAPRMLSTRWMRSESLLASPRARRNSAIARAKSPRAPRATPRLTWACGLSSFSRSASRRHSAIASSSLPDLVRASAKIALGVLLRISGSSGLCRAASRYSLIASSSRPFSDSPSARSLWLIASSGLSRTASRYSLIASSTRPLFFLQ